MAKNNSLGGICPACQSPVDLLSQQCCCPAKAPSVSLAAQAEAVFESYLAARVVRARRDLTAAKIALLRDPKNRTKLEALRRARAEAEQLQAQLVEQTRKASKARTRMLATDAPGNNTSAGETASAKPPTEARLARMRPDNRDCPRCGRQLPGDAIGCGCGHKLTSDATHLTAQFLSEAELLALRTRK